MRRCNAASARPGLIVATKALLDENPNPTETEARYWLAGNLCRCTGYDKIIRAVMDAAAVMRGETVWMNYIDSSLKVVGTRPIRPDGVDKVTGRAVFAADTRASGMLWGKILRSPHAHARIVSIDTSKAEALPGVQAVVTAADFPDIPSEEAFVGEGPMNFRDLSLNVMARDKVLYEGHAVAAVAATTQAIADEALALIDVKYEVLPHRHRRRRGDGRRRARSARRHVHRRRQSEADQAVQHRQGRDLQEGRRRGRLQGRRRHRRRPLHHAAGASGLYRAACLPRDLCAGRPGHDPQLQPGPFHGPRLHGEAAGHRHGQHPRSTRPKSAAASAARR